MGNDHEDYETGAAPAAHHETHEHGGTDQASIASLLGVPFELAAHAVLPSIHHLRYTDVEAAAAAAALILIHKGDAVAHQDTPQLILDHKGDAVAHQDAPQLILDHKGDASAHHGRYTDGEAQTVADARILTHKNIATAHQDAPTLILTHKGDASAHHAKYTDAEARAAIYATKPCFIAKITSLQTDVTGDGTSYDITGAIWSEYADQGANFLNGVFTAPGDGLYLFTGAIGHDGVLATHTYGYAQLVTTIISYTIFSINPGAIAGATSLLTPFCFYANMLSGQTAYLLTRIYYGAKVVDVSTGTFFGGSRII